MCVCVCVCVRGCGRKIAEHIIPAPTNTCDTQTTTTTTKIEEVEDTFLKHLRSLI